MQTRPLNRLLGRVRRTLAAHQTDDATLLRAYRDDHDPDALDALVRKYAPLVHAACRKVLPDSEADDVFQATFLVLMRDAKAIRKGQSVGSWLYGVAHRLALQARVGRARRVRIEAKARTRLRPRPIRRGRKRASRSTRSWIVCRTSTGSRCSCVTSTGRAGTRPRPNSGGA